MALDLEPRNAPNTRKHLFYPEEVYLIQGAIFEVRRVMGPGFLEAVYQECLALELTNRSIPFQASPRLNLRYKDHLLQQAYIPDFVCFGLIGLELKACREIAPEHRAQLLNYLKAGELKLGLLVNFGAPQRVAIERLAL